MISDEQRREYERIDREIERQFQLIYDKIDGREHIHESYQAKINSLMWKSIWLAIKVLLLGIAIGWCLRQLYEQQ